MIGNSLAIIYTFAPYVDTAGIVFAKRINTEYKENFTVISCKPYSGAPEDETLHKIISDSVSKTIEVDAKFTYRDWHHFSDFIDKSLESYKNELAAGTVYQKIYSRSMSVISHLVAYKIKCITPELEWIAEFSDPIIKDVTGEDRETLIPETWLKKNIDVSELQVFKKYNNLFSLSEVLVYLYADKIVFTNSIQKEYMLSYFFNDLLNLSLKEALSTKIESKSVISKHPTLSSKYYERTSYSGDVDTTLINIAYFGNINSRRSFSSFFDSWRMCDEKLITNFRLYIFSNINSDKILSNVPLELRKYVIVNKGLNYLDFLGSLKIFDYLLTVDTEVKDTLGVNPFLPSKISDYLGSTTKILALIEKDSPTYYLNNSNILKFLINDFNSKDFHTIKNYS